MISKPAIGKLFNQDCIGTSKSGIWLLDGISEVRALSMNNRENAVVWFVNKINEYLLQNLDQKDLPLTEILTCAIIDIREGIESLISADIDSLHYYEQPSTSIIIARNIQDKELEIFSLGDCLAYLRTLNQEILVQNYELRRIEEHFRNKMLLKKEKYPEMTHTDFLNEINIFDRLKQLRADLTQNNQYHILNLDPAMISKGQESFFPSINSVTLMSDGFSRIIDIYHLFENYNDLILNLEEQGVKKIYEKMRDIEHHDLNAQKYPRLFVSDDASLILASLE